ncbi:hypothetical protein HDU90_006635 [Geranomyces variabilis]|nr:hypothetical protein HDU90_006635 [Geranomyces variabilis]
MRYPRHDSGGPLHRAMLRQFAPEGLAMGDDWMADPVQRRKALVRKGEQLRAGLPEDFFSPEAQRLRALGQQQRTPIKFDVNDTFTRGLFTEMFRGMGVPDTVMPTHWWARLGSKMSVPGEIYMRFGSRTTAIRFLGFLCTFNLFVDDEPQHLRAPVSFVPKLKGETGTVHFLANGIGSRNAIAAAAVAPGPPPPSAEVKGAQFADKRLSRHIARNDVLADKRLSRHIARNDGLWLFKKWLDTQFPQGGVLSTATLREFPDRDDTFEEHLGAFLAQHTTHPHYATVLPWVRNIKTHSKKVLANIRFLRDSTRAPEQMKKWTTTPLVGAPPQKITFSISHFGPALPNPHFV